MVGKLTKNQNAHLIIRAAEADGFPGWCRKIILTSPLLKSRRRSRFEKGEMEKQAGFSGVLERQAKIRYYLKGHLKRALKEN